MPRRPGHALAASLLDRDADGYRLAPHTQTLLVDDTSPAFAGSIFTVLEQPEDFSRFEASIAGGQRTWWDQTSPPPSPTLTPGSAPPPAAS